VGGKNPCVLAGKQRDRASGGGPGGGGLTQGHSTDGNTSVQGVITDANLQQEAPQTMLAQHAQPSCALVASLISACVVCNIRMQM